MSELHNIVNILNQRGNSLLVACQLVDFFAFLSLGGICSKSKLSQSGVTFSEYESDIHLKNNGFWDAHIFHLTDYGSWFYRKATHTPNPLGPVLIHIKPDILKQASSVNFTNLSVRNEQFDPKTHAMSFTPDRLNECYQYPDDTPFPELSMIKEALIDRDHIAGIAPEIVCQFDSQIIPFSHVSLVNVDHYIINNRQFQGWVDEIKVRAGYTFPLMRRYCPSSTAIHISSEIGKILLNGPATLDDICQSDDNRVAAWGKSLTNSQIFDIYAKHLRTDTLLPLNDGRISPEQIDHLTEIVQKKAAQLNKLSEKDAHLILTELAQSDPNIARRINALLSK